MTAQRNPHAPGEPDAPFVRILDRLAADLIGPGPNEGPMKDYPSDRFMTGILYAKQSRIETEEEETEGEVAAGRDTDNHERTPRIESAAKPSAAGLSFALATVRDLPSEISIAITGARYEVEGEAEDDKREGPVLWQRRSVAGTLREFDIDERKGNVELAPDLGDDFAGLKFAVVTTPFEKADVRAGESARLVTLVVYNEGSDSFSDRNDRIGMNCKALFEFRMAVRAGDGSRLIGRPLRDGGDDAAAALLWRDSVEYAVGHTCAAAWDEAPVEEIATAWLPATRVPATSSDGDPVFETPGKQLVAETLAREGDEDRTLAILRDLVAAYETWIAAQRGCVNKAVPERLHAQATNHLDTCADAATRMREGIDNLANDPALMRAFRLANRAMHLQQTWKSDRPLVWRPFQLAFVLLSAASAIDPAHDARKTMDLIWFPTGGGKTEAYLLLTAFTIFARRFKRGEAGLGVAAIMRYTLRLLTLQQFERAAAMICAADAVWREDGAGAHEERISLGLWLGGETTPNRLWDACKILDGGAVKGVGTPARLALCPCCGDTLDWHTVGEDIVVTCGTDGCVVGDEGPLPIHTVDESVYDHRPSLIIGTADKFAQIARNPRTTCLFGDVNDPPDLIIQDELHLISGPLGTLTGLYETAIDALCTREGRRPKVIGSTATIRRASEQVRALFDRETFQFPPPGIDASNSGFAVEDEDPKRPGRLFVGASTVGHSKPEMLQAVCASLLQSAADPVLTPEERDASWTLLGYFNSLRELGGSVTLLQAIAPETMERLAVAYGETVRDVDTQIEVTSRVPSSEIGNVLSHLERKESTGDAVDVALATNMISVGVDVGRLGLMIVDGQPKGISEYIQATSRVGRGDTPGLVVGLYTAYRPRDRSRFETHRTWHSALYRDVEPTSVTPFAPRARDRALHAPFVALAAHEHIDLWSAPSLAESKRGSLDAIMERIVARVRSVDEDEADATASELKNFLDAWCLRDGLQHWWKDNQDNALLMSSEAAAQRAAARRPQKSAKPTPNSMRGVEATVKMVLGSFPDD